MWAISNQRPYKTVRERGYNCVRILTTSMTMRFSWDTLQDNDNVSDKRQTTSVEGWSTERRLASFNRVPVIPVNRISATLRPKRANPASLSISQWTTADNLKMIPACLKQMCYTRRRLVSHLVTRCAVGQSGYSDSRINTRPWKQVGLYVESHCLIERYHIIWYASTKWSVYHKPKHWLADQTEMEEDSVEGTSSDLFCIHAITFPSLNLRRLLISTAARSLLRHARHSCYTVETESQHTKTASYKKITITYLIFKFNVS